MIYSLDEGNIADWRTQGVQYAIIDLGDYQTLQATPEGQAQLAQMTLLKTFPASPVYRGPAMVVLRLYPIQHKLDGQLGSIHLIGYDMDRSVAYPGDSVTFTLYWQALSPTDTDYTVFNHLIKADAVDIAASDITAQVDGLPLRDERRPTNTWSDPGETLMSCSFTLTLSSTTAPGTYRLLTGFYQRGTGLRLQSPENHDSLEVAQIVVLDPKLDAVPRQSPF